MADYETTDVVHDVERRRFRLEVDGHEAYLAYRREAPDRVNFAHTFTPPELRGRGIASVVVKRGLEWARESGTSIKAGCPYVSSYLERHPEYADLVARERDEV